VYKADLDRFDPKEALLAFEDLSESDWDSIKDILPRECGRQGRPAIDNRQIVNGILWRFHTNAPWRELPEKYGKWITVYQRFRRWNRDGIWVQLRTIHRASANGHAKTDNCAND